MNVGSRLGKEFQSRGGIRCKIFFAPTHFSLALVGGAGHRWPGREGLAPHGVLRGGGLDPRAALVLRVGLGAIPHTRPWINIDWCGVGK